jgi:hypothetical protein
MQAFLGLNATHMAIRKWDTNSRNPALAPADRNMQATLAHLGLNRAADRLELGYWKPGYTWRCPNNSLAKLMYGWAACIILWGEVSEAPVALEFIEIALDRLPNDAVIQKEKEDTENWAQGNGLLR